MGDRSTGTAYEKPQITKDGNIRELTFTDPTAGMSCSPPPGGMWVDDDGKWKCHKHD
ncbi:MAG: hypothetical protein ACYCXJ_06685 [Thermoleophilia bacterium]